MLKVSAYKNCLKKMEKNLSANALNTRFLSGWDPKVLFNYLVNYFLIFYKRLHPGFLTITITKLEKVLKIFSKT